jgi:molybdopterin-binding protein
MKLSARNQLAGTVVSVVKGQTTAHVRVDVGGGKIITSSITNEAVDDLGLVVGDTVTAVIKSSDDWEVAQLCRLTYFKAYN